MTDQTEAEFYGNMSSEDVLTILSESVQQFFEGSKNVPEPDTIVVLIERAYYAFGEAFEPWQSSVARGYWPVWSWTDFRFSWMPSPPLIEQWESEGLT